MKILILGATGFIGSAVARKLLADGHSIAGLGRNLEAARCREPLVRWIEGDLRKFTTPSFWQPALTGIDAVVNCAGTLQDTVRDNVTAVQEKAMLALYEAVKVKPDMLVVQVSAARSLAATGTEFMSTKLRADDALSVSGISHVILRPALVLGRNAHGGSALLRALAAIPCATPLAWPETQIETVSLERVTTEVARAVAGQTPSGSDLDLVDNASPLRILVAAHRAWLGLSQVRTVSIPPTAARFVSRLADAAGWFGWRSPLRSTAMVISGGGIVSGAARPVAEDVPILPPDMREHPAGVQDVWFARLYLLKPLLIVALAMFWLVSGVVPLMDAQRVAQRFSDVFSPTTAIAITIATSLADVALGIAVLFRKHARNAMLGMIGLSLAYLAGASIIEPTLWLDPLGPLVKVFPSLALTLATLAILEER